MRCYDRRRRRSIDTNFMTLWSERLRTEPGAQEHTRSRGKYSLSLRSSCGPMRSCCSRTWYTSLDSGALMLLLSRPSSRCLFVSDAVANERVRLQTRSPEYIVPSDAHNHPHDQQRMQATLVFVDCCCCACEKVNILMLHSTALRTTANTNGMKRPGEVRNRTCARRYIADVFFRSCVSTSFLNAYSSGFVRFDSMRSEGARVLSRVNSAYVQPDSRHSVLFCAGRRPPGTRNRYGSTDSAQMPRRSLLKRAKQC